MMRGRSYSPLRYLETREVVRFQLGTYSIRRTTRLRSPLDDWITNAAQGEMDMTVGGFDMLCSMHVLHARAAHEEGEL